MSSIWSGGESIVGPPYQLDDIVQEGVKFQQSSVERWYFEALSCRFAAIKVPPRRLSLIFSDVTQEDPNFLLTICQQEVKIAKYHLSKLTGPSLKLNYLFAHLFRYRFKSITVNGRELSQRQLEKLLKAAASIDEADNATTIHAHLLTVRRFHFNYMHRHYFSETEEQCLAIWLDQLAPSVRHLRIGQDFDPMDESESDRSPVAQLTAIGHCHRLRSLDLNGLQCSIVMLASAVQSDALLKTICAALPHLHALRIITTSPQREPLSPHDRSLTLLDSWLDRIVDTQMEAQKQLFGKIHHFCYSVLYAPRFPELPSATMARLDFIISSMGRQSLAACRQVTVDMIWYFRRNHDFSNSLFWLPTSLNDWLRVAGDCRASITLACKTLPLPTVEQFNAIKDTIEQAYIPGLMPLPVHNPQEILFEFHNGAQLRLRFETAYPPWESDYEYSDSEAEDDEI